MKVFYVNNSGGGFAAHIEVEPGTTVSQFFQQHQPNQQPGDCMIRVNRQVTVADQVLVENDRITITPVKITGA